MWMKDLCGTDKPIIALLHLDPLPGEPGFKGSLGEVMSHARADLESLQSGGVDAVLIANEYCTPITPNTAPETLMAMAAVIGSLKRDIQIPFGTNVVYDPESTIRMGAALGASFGRSAFAGAFTGTYGIHSVNFGDMVRLTRSLGIPEFKLLHKFNPEGDAFIRDIPLKNSVNAICSGNYIGALCVSGPGAGKAADMKLLEEVTELAHNKNTPVFCNTGCRHDTIQGILKIADGACVGTALKENGRVSVEKVRSFMNLARA